ncbi:hypothetical protein [Shewanella goraebulensis]|uniref:hypothetical protein n=1 Tax=Shewanella goraebulensis TaxID=3050637 RepID=UPI002549DBA7|nr:hypothetical protein [Shewanella goraebulensis]
MEFFFNTLFLFFKSGKRMPRLFMFMYGVNAITFVPLLLFGFWPWPSATYKINGEVLSYSEFWLSGAGPLFLVFISCMAYLSFATAKGLPWSRWGNLLYWSAIFLLFGYGSVVGLIISFTLAAALWLYIFRSTKVVAYYSSFGLSET